MPKKTRPGNPPAPKIERNPDGTFKRGAPSPNPTGRSKVEEAYREKAQQYGWDALDTLWEMMMDPDVPHASRVSAASDLLDRGFGKPRQAMDVTSGGEKMALGVVVLPPEDPNG